MRAAGGELSKSQQSLDEPFWPIVLQQRLLTFCQLSPVFRVDLGFVQHLAQKLNFARQPLGVRVVFWGGRLRNWCPVANRFWGGGCGEGKNTVKLGWVDLVVAVFRLQCA